MEKLPCRSPDGTGCTELFYIIVCIYSYDLSAMMQLLLTSFLGSGTFYLEGKMESVNFHDRPIDSVCREL